MGQQTVTELERATGGRSPADAGAAHVKELHAKIGELTVKRDFLERGLRLLLGRSAKR